MTKVMKNVIKWGMLLYPVVRAIINEKNKKETYSGRKSRK